MALTAALAARVEALHRQSDEAMRLRVVTELTSFESGSGDGLDAGSAAANLTLGSTTDPLSISDLCIWPTQHVFQLSAYESSVASGTPTRSA